MPEQRWPAKIEAMKQISLGLNLSTKKTRKREFLEQVEKVVPWAALVQIVAPHYPKSKTGRPPFPIETMLRIHYMQQWLAPRPRLFKVNMGDLPRGGHRRGVNERPVHHPGEEVWGVGYV